MISHQGTRFHVLPLRVHMLQLNILSAATKAWHSQINKYRKDTQQKTLIISVELMYNIVSGVQYSDSQLLKVIVYL